MFFSVDILCRRDSRFAPIWLAATKAKKLKRRDIERVDVEKACSDLLKHLPRTGDLHQAPSRRSLFSLYLSSQLMYGTIWIYDKQLKYLLDDLKQIVDNIKKLLTVGISIDLDKPFGRNIDMPDPLQDMNSLLMGNFGRPGFDSPVVMDFGERDYLEVMTARSGAEEEGYQTRCIAPYASITLQEDDWQLASLLPPFEEDFPIVEGEIPTVADVQEFEAMQKELMLPPPSPITRHPGPFEEIIEPGEPVGETPYTEPAQVGQPLAPAKAPPPAADVTRRQLETRPRTPRKQAPAFDLSPIEAGPHVPTPRRRIGVRRQRLIIDRTNSMPGDEMRQQIDDFVGNSRTHQEIWIDIAQAQRNADTREERPGLPLGDGIADFYYTNLTSRREPGEFQDIFRSPAWTVQGHLDEFMSPTIAPLEETQPLPMVPEDQEMVEAPPVAEALVVEDERELGSIEAQRQADERHRQAESLGGQTDVGMDTVTPQAITMEPTEEQLIQEDVGPPMEEPAAKRPRRSPPPVDHLAECYPAPPDMPNSVPQTFSLQRQQLQNHVYEMTSGGSAISFEEMCPVEVATRAQAAKTFYMLLDLCRQRKIAVEQDEPYGSVTIRRA